MKKTIVLSVIIVLALAVPASAQKSEKINKFGQIGITFSTLGNCDVISFDKTVGGAGYLGNSFFSTGMTWLYKLNKTFDFETGVDYTAYKIIITSNLPPQMEAMRYSERLALIGIPLTMRVNFLKCCFINGGISLDMDTNVSNSINNQTGIGASLGCGLKYDFKSGLSVFINPYSKVHSLISFLDYQYPKRMADSGFRFGITYCLGHRTAD
jgi:hypothetical protein